MAVGDGFHVDSSGNLWLGSTRETFDATTRSEAPFYIYANGSIVANNGTFSGDISGASGTFTGDLSGADITGGTINIGSGTFQVDSSGNMTATSATLSGYLAAGSSFDDLTETGSIVGWVLDSSNGRFIGEDGSGNYLYLDSSGNIAGNYSAGTSGWKINANGDAEFNSVDIRIKASGASEGDVPSDGTQSIQIGSAQIYESNNNLYLNSNSSGNKIIISAGDKFVLSGSSANPNLTFDGASTQDIEFNAAYITDSDTSDGRSYSSEALGQVYELTISNQNVDIYRVNAQNNDVYFYGDVEVDGHIEVNSLKVYDGFGSSGEVLTRTSNGLEWASAGGAHADSDHSFDNYGSWTLKRGGSTIGNVQSGYGVSWNAGSGLSVSSNNNPFTITYSADFGTNNSQVARGDHSHTGTGISQINSPSTGFFSGYTFNSSTGAFSVSTSNTNTSSTTVGNLFPNASSSDLGHPFGNGEWDRLYIQNNPNVSSDERKKENIEDLTFGLDYIKTLVPKSYTLKSDENSKVHWGFIAQELLETPPEPELDVAFVDYQEEHDHYSVAYAELIAPLVKAVQELSAKNDALESRIAALEA